MSLEDMISLFVNNGIGVVCIAYFIVRDYKFMNTLNATLKSLEDSVKLIQDYFIKKEG
jgi:hypothetical protein